MFSTKSSSSSPWPSNLPVNNEQLMGAAIGLIILVVAAVLLRPSSFDSVERAGVRGGGGG